MLPGSENVMDMTLTYNVENVIPVGELGVFCPRAQNAPALPPTLQICTSTPCEVSVHCATLCKVRPLPGAHKHTFRVNAFVCWSCCSMIVPWGQDYGLGMGYQTETNKAVVSPITFTGDKGTPTAKVVTNTFLVSNSEQYTELLQASSDIGLIYGMGSVGLSASLSECMEIKQNTLHVVVLTKHTSEPKELSDARLEDLSKRKLQRDGPESFHRVFGDRWERSRLAVLVGRQVVCRCRWSCATVGSSQVFTITAVSQLTAAHL